MMARRLDDESVDPTAYLVTWVGWRDFATWENVEEYSRCYPALVAAWQADGARVLV